MRHSVDTDDLHKWILAAFADVAKPSGLDVAPHECLECDDVRRALAPYEFSQLPDEAFRSIFDSLPLLSPKGLHHYLPAYLLRTLREPNWNGSAFVLYHLGPDEKQRAEPYWQERFSLFTKRQRSAICAFLEWFSPSPFAEGYEEHLSNGRDVWCNNA